MLVQVALSTSIHIVCHLWLLGQEYRWDTVKELKEWEITDIRRNNAEMEGTEVLIKQK